MLFDESWIERLFLQLRQSNSLSFHIKHYNFNRIPAKKAFTLLQTQLHYSVHSSFVIPHKRAASLALDRHVVLWLWKKYVKKKKTQNNMGSHLSQPGKRNDGSDDSGGHVLLHTEEHSLNYSF